MFIYGTLVRKLISQLEQPLLSKHNAPRKKLKGLRLSGARSLRGGFINPPVSRTFWPFYVAARTPRH